MRARNASADVPSVTAHKAATSKTQNSHVVSSAGAALNPAAAPSSAASTTFATTPSSENQETAPSDGNSTFVPPNFFSRFDLGLVATAGAGGAQSSGSIRRVRLAELEPHLRSIADPYAEYCCAEDAVAAGAAAAAPTVSGAIEETKTTEENFLKSKASVPPVFFEEDFNLSNPLHFEQVLSAAAASTTAAGAGTGVLGLSPDDLSPDGLPALASTQTISESVSRLTSVLTLVETLLSREISSRSDSFFMALGDLDGLHSETSACLAQIEKLRAALADVARSQSQNALETVRLTMRRTNLQRLHSCLSSVRSLWHSVPTISAFVSMRNYVAAIDLAHDCIRALRHAFLMARPPVQEKTSPTASNQENVTLPTQNSALVLPREMSSVKLFSILYHKLAESTKSIGSLLEADFCEVLCAFLVEDFKNENALASPTNTANELNVVSPVSPAGASSSGSVVKAATVQTLYERLMPLVFALVRIGNFGHAMAVYRDKFPSIVIASLRHCYPKEIKALFDSPKPSASKTADLVTPSIMASFSKALHSTPFDAYCRFLVKCFSGCHAAVDQYFTAHEAIVKCLESCKAQNVGFGNDRCTLIVPQAFESLNATFAANYIDELTPFDNSTQSPNPYTSLPRQPEKQLVSDGQLNTTTYEEAISVSHGCVRFGVETWHSRISRLLELRADLNAQLMQHDFLKLYKACSEFISASEKKVNARIAPLQKVLQDQGKAFVDRMHNDCINKLNMLVEAEQWAASDVLEDFQKVFDFLSNEPSGVNAA